MAANPHDAKRKDETHLEFVKRRARTTDFMAAEKLRRIDELAEIIYTARENYRRARVEVGEDGKKRDS